MTTRDAAGANFMSYAPSPQPNDLATLQTLHTNAISSAYHTKYAASFVIAGPATDKAISLHIMKAQAKLSPNSHLVLERATVVGLGTDTYPNLPVYCVMLDDVAMPVLSTPVAFVLNKRLGSYGLMNVSTVSNPTTGTVDTPLQDFQGFTFLNLEFSSR